MDTQTIDRLEMYKKWAEDLDIDYNESFGQVDDPDYLVQISRDGLQEQIEKDISEFTEEALQQIKECDLFILDNIENSSRWLSPDRSKPKRYWWWYLDEIKSGKLDTPDIDAIFDEYFLQLKNS